MSTEYRRGIPSTAHVEAATRLGLLWEDDDVGTIKARWRLEARADGIRGDYATSSTNYTNWDLGPLVRAPVRNQEYRPIRPNGTPVDWEVLDQEVARVGQQGLPATVTPPASAAPTMQPQGFRADLWRRIRRHFSFVSYDGGEVASLSELSDIDDVGIHSRHWQWGWGTADREALTRQQRADILGRWTVYQELKPLYDLVDGAQGEAAMPADVEAEWITASCGSPPTTRKSDGRLGRDGQGLYLSASSGLCWRQHENVYGPPLRNFAAVLDAVAERRVAERMRGQTQAPTVTSQPEPRRFADVRPDRHGWRWWRQTGRDSTDLGQRFETLDGRCRWRSAHADAWFVPDTANPQMLRYTVIPTDEQGNPVSWESIGPTDPTEIRLTSASNAPDRHGTRWAASVSAMQNYAVPDIYITVGTDAKPTQTEAVTTLPPPLPRFTTDELDDVDHSKTTKLDEVTLRRGKLPTVEQIAKYREVRARRAGGTVADALKESRIDCEVAQYVLERWAGGLGDEEAHDLIHSTATLRVVVKGVVHIKAVDNRVVSVLSDCYSLDTSEKPSPAVQRERQEAEERRQRLAQLRQRLAAERTAQPQEMAKESEVSRFDLIEPDPQADPTASIRAWEARQAAAKVRPAAALPRIAKPAATPRRPAIEVVDAEMDGLSRSEAFAALFGRALNGGC